VVFYCGASKTRNLSLLVEESTNAFDSKMRQSSLGINQSCSNRLRVQIIPHLYNWYFSGLSRFTFDFFGFTKRKREYIEEKTTATLKSKQTSIATIQNHLRTLANLPLPSLITRCL
jgi:hypothetical protein